MTIPKNGAPGDLPPVPVNVPDDAWDNVIRAYGIANACEWFGHDRGSEFTADTIKTLEERNAAAVIVANALPRELFEQDCPVLAPREKLILMAPPGWAYTGYDGEGGFYLFQTGNYADGFREMRALLEDLTPENLARMAELGVTR
jgi:pimeloyl-ACP methyl ester carboxylesterase